jgi:hypothetical protein
MRSFVSSVRAGARVSQLLTSMLLELHWWQSVTNQESVIEFSQMKASGGLFTKILIAAC